MKTIKAISFKKQVIEFSNSTELHALYNILEKEENFILQWNEEGLQKSQVMVCKKFKLKVSSGQLKLIAQQKKGGMRW